MDKTYTFTYRHSRPEELAAPDRQLVERARAAAAAAYAPYSGFRVGAAARLDDGEVLTASNQESEVFPSGMCAERILLYWLQANAGGRRIEALAVATDSGRRECYPCAACRQVIADTEKRQGTPIRILMAGTASVTELDSAKPLVPFRFEL